MRLHSDHLPARGVRYHSLEPSPDHPMMCLPAGLDAAQHQLQSALHSAAPYVDDALGRMQHFVSPHVSQAKSFADRHVASTVQHIQPQMLYLHAKLQEGIQHSTARVDAGFQDLQPWQIAAVTAVLLLVSMWVLSRLLAIYAEVRETGMCVAHFSPCLGMSGMFTLCKTFSHLCFHSRFELFMMPVAMACRTCAEYH